MKKIIVIGGTFRAFAVAGALAAALAGCAADGSVKPSTQSKLVQACDNASTAITLAGFFADKMNATEYAVYSAAEKAIPGFCSPSALAADLSPAALSFNIQTLGDIVQQMHAVSAAVPGGVGDTLPAESVR
jgi:hypothetical protein